MPTFNQIVKESEKTRDRVYFLQDEQGKKYFAPRKKKISEAKKIQRLRKREKTERAERLASLVHTGGLDKCEELGVDICSLIEEPKYISKTDGDLPVLINLIRKIME